MKSGPGAHDQVRQRCLCLTFRCFESLRVIVHFLFQGGMSQEFLDNLRIHTPVTFLVNPGVLQRRIDVVTRHGCKPERCESCSGVNITNACALAFPKMKKQILIFPSATCFFIDSFRNKYLASSSNSGFVRQAVPVVIFQPPLVACPPLRAP